MVDMPIFSGAGSSAKMPDDCLNIYAIRGKCAVFLPIGNSYFMISPIPKTNANRIFRIILSSIKPHFFLAQFSRNLRLFFFFSLPQHFPIFLSIDSISLALIFNIFLICRSFLRAYFVSIFSIKSGRFFPKIVRIYTWRAFSHRTSNALHTMTRPRPQGMSSSLKFVFALAKFAEKSAKNVRVSVVNAPSSHRRSNSCNTSRSRLAREFPTADRHGESAAEFVFCAVD